MRKAYVRLKKRRTDSKRQNVSINRTLTRKGERVIKKWQAVH